MNKKLKLIMVFLVLVPIALALNFRVKDDSSTFFMVNGSSGFVGVGLINPIALFHVNGNAYVDGDLNVTGTIFGGSPVKVGGGLNISSGELYFPDGTSQSTAASGSSTEDVQDAAWDVTTGTQTHITVTYQDDNNEVDFVVSDDWYDSPSDVTGGFGCSEPDEYLAGDGNCYSEYDAGDDLVDDINEWDSQCTDCVGNDDLNPNSVDLTSDALSSEYAGTGLTGGGSSALSVNTGNGLDTSGDSVIADAGSGVIVNSTGINTNISYLNARCADITGSEDLCDGEDAGVGSCDDCSGTFVDEGQANSISSGMVAFNYAASTSEGGPATSGDSATNFFSSGTIEDARLSFTLQDAVDDGGCTNCITDAMVSDTLTASDTTCSAESVLMGDGNCDAKSSFGDGTGTDDQTLAEVLSNGDTSTTDQNLIISDGSICADDSAGTCAGSNDGYIYADVFYDNAGFVVDGDITAVSSGEGTKGGTSDGAATIEFDCSEVASTHLACSGEDIYVSTDFEEEAHCTEHDGNYLSCDGEELDVDASSVCSACSYDNYGDWNICDDDGDCYNVVGANDVRFTSSSGYITTNLINGDDGDENINLGLGSIGACSNICTDATDDTVSESELDNAYAGMGTGYVYFDDSTDAVSTSQYTTATDTDCSSDYVLMGDGTCDAKSTFGDGTGSDDQNFGEIGTGTATSVTFTVGNGASIAATGTGTINATDVVCTNCLTNTEVASADTATTATTANSGDSATAFFSSGSISTTYTDAKCTDAACEDSIASCSDVNSCTIIAEDTNCATDSVLMGDGTCDTKSSFGDGTGTDDQTLAEVLSSGSTSTTNQNIIISDGSICADNGGGTCAGSTDGYIYADVFYDNAGFVVDGDITAVSSGEGTKGGTSDGAATIEFDCSEVASTHLACSGEDIYVSTDFEEEAHCTEHDGNYLSCDGEELDVDASSVCSACSYDNYGDWNICDDDGDCYNVVGANDVRFTSSSGYITTNLINGDDGDENINLGLGSIGACSNICTDATDDTVSESELDNAYAGMGTGYVYFDDSTDAVSTSQYTTATDTDCSSDYVLMGDGTCDAKSTFGDGTGSDDQNFGEIGTGTATSVTFTVGDSASLATTGTGTITATDVSCTNCLTNTEVASADSATTATTATTANSGDSATAFFSSGSISTTYTDAKCTDSGCADSVASCSDVNSCTIVAEDTNCATDSVLMGDGTCDTKSSFGDGTGTDDQTLAEVLSSGSTSTTNQNIIISDGSICADNGGGTCAGSTDGYIYADVFYDNAGFVVDGDITAVSSGEGTKGGTSDGSATIEFDCSEVAGTHLSCSGEDIYVSTDFEEEAHCTEHDGNYLTCDGEELDVDAASVCTACGAITACTDCSATFVDEGQANSISSGMVAFNYAGSSSEGGAADDLSCTGCVDATDLADSFDSCSDCSTSFLSEDSSDVWNEDGGSDTLRFEGNTDTNLLYLDGADDYVGIGTNSPNHKLDIQGGSLRIDSGQPIELSDSNWQLGRNIISDSGGMLTSNTIQMKVWDDATQGFQIINSNNDVPLFEVGGTGDAHIYGDLGIGTNNPASELEIETSGTNNAYMYLDSPTNYDSGIALQEGGTSRWVLYNDGSGGDDLTISGGSEVVIPSAQLGIGTNSPSTAVEIESSGTNNAYLTLDAPTNYDSGIAFQESGGSRWIIHNDGNSEDDLTITGGNEVYINAKVGIYKYDPTYALDVSGTARADNFELPGGSYIGGSSGTIDSYASGKTYWDSDNDADVYWRDQDSSYNDRMWLDISSGNLNIDGNYYDYAETIPIKGPIVEPGELVAADPEGVYGRKSNGTNKIIGVISTRPGILLSLHNDKENDSNTAFGTADREFDYRNNAPLTLAGRVPTKVTSIDGDIINGNPVAPADIHGIGMKATRSGTTVGKALESTSHWNKQNCPAVESIDSIEWPEDDGTNPEKPCFRVPLDSLDEKTKEKVKNEYNLTEHFYVGKIMVFVNVDYWEPEGHEEEQTSQTNELKQRVEFQEEKIQKLEDENQNLKTQIDQITEVICEENPEIQMCSQNIYT